MDGKEKTSSGKTGPCSNCGRSKFIADKDGHCGTCHDSVEGLVAGSQEYVAALADVKARVTDPNFKRIGNRRGLAKKTDLPAQKTKVKKRAIKEPKVVRDSKTLNYDQYVQQCKKQNFPPVSLAEFVRVSVRQNLNHAKAQTPIKWEIFQYPPAVIIETLQNQYDYHLEAANKFKQAIDILQS